VPKSLNPICNTCTHYTGLDVDAGYVCKAFPKGIPLLIMVSAVDHTKPFEGDGGIVYEAEGEPAKDRAFFVEGEHPRDVDGKFTSGSGGGSKSDVTHFTKSSPVPKELNGIPFKTWHPPDDWSKVSGTNSEIKEPPMVAGRKRVSSGVVIHEPDGRIWLTKPLKQFGGYRYTFPKGGEEEGLSLQQNAIKEAFEETGLKAKITGFAGDWHGDTSVTRLYHAVRESGHPHSHGWESEAITLAPKEKAGKLLNRSRDKAVLKYLQGKSQRPKSMVAAKDTAFDPPVSEQQRKAMFAAAAGHSTLGIPKKVGEEFSEADPGGKLPSTAKDMTKVEWGALRKLFNKFFGEEEKEPEHEEDAEDGGPGSGPHKGGGSREQQELESQSKSFHQNRMEQDPEYRAKHETREHLTNLKALISAGKKKEAAEYVKKHGLAKDAYDQAALSTAPNSGIPQAAGVAHVTPEGRCLLLKRAGASDSKGTWAFPGGMAEGEETAEQAARRECQEEIGNQPNGDMKQWDCTTGDKLAYTTFAHAVDKSFVPTLNDEHDDWMWADIDDLPDNLHPGVRKVLDKVLAEHLKGEEVLGTAFGTPVENGEDEEPDKLSKTTRKDIGTPGSEKREDMPEDVFLGPDRTYPVKEERDGKYEYTSHLLEAAAARAKQQGKPEIAKRAMEIHEREFGGGDDNVDEAALAADKMPDGFRLNEYNGSFEYLAFDRATTRSYDNNGFMSSEKSNISKATVNPYYGREINATMKNKPGWVPLKDEQQYNLLRHPEELAKAAPTFNGLPILNNHVALNSSKFKPEMVIGATGSDSEFSDPYLSNSLKFWRKPHIDDIEDGRKSQLSSAYSYEADMTPGEYNGVPYDGVMRNIKGNHVALVKEGRAGPDVVVEDEDKTPVYATAKGRPQPSPFSALVSKTIFKRARDSSTEELAELLSSGGLAYDSNLEDDDMPVSARTLRQARILKHLAMDASPEDMAEYLEAMHGGKDEDLDDDDGMVDDKKRAADRRRKADDAMRRALDAKDWKGAHDALKNFFGARDESKEEEEGGWDEEEEEEKEWKEKENAESEDRKRRAEDAKRKLGRDESEEERDMRERADDARMRLGRDESEEEKEEREEGEAEDRKRRAEDARQVLGRDETPDESCRRGELERAADRKRFSEDSRKKWAEDRRMKKAEDKRRAEDRRRTEDRRPRRTEDEDPHMKPAMDERQVQTAISRALATERRNQTAKAEAIRAVRPWVGDVPAMDEMPTADSVFAKALEMRGVDTKGVHPSAYKAILEAQPRPGASPRVVPREAGMAFDSKGNKSFTDMFPETTAIKVM
jgi:8-oxo-dGTP pyrophosphatase MutT (NUDIX family)